jgi:hypothetical protein
MSRLAVAFVLGGLAFGGPLEAQLAERVDELDEGVARFGYQARPDVEVCDQGIRIGEGHVWWRSERGEQEATNCTLGFVEVDVTVRGGRVRAVEVVRGERGQDAARAGGVVELGEVGPSEAVDLLLSLARGDASTDAGEDAILPAVLADVDELWPQLLGLARDRRVHVGVRKSALFWVGQEAADVVTEELSDVALADDEEQEVREAAIFALSQRPPEESVPALIEIARTGREAETRKTAMFWLAQSEDPRVLAFFEDVLLGRVN